MAANITAQKTIYIHISAMKKIFYFIFVAVFLYSCDSEDTLVTFPKIDDVGLRVSFTSQKSALGQKIEMTEETPENYYVALKSVRLLGVGETADFELFNKPDLASSLVFDYTDDAVVHSLLEGAEIPEGDYNRIEIEIYYLQMNIAIATGERGTERRNFRIYLSDDAETEDGVHQPGDLTQINDGVEIGWLLGEGQTPNLDPVSPRVAAYTYGGDGSSWYNFNGKPGNNYGPFGNVDFFATATQPVYTAEVAFAFVDNNGSRLILDFNVEGCWQFEDKSGDGVFGPDDLDPVNPTRWHMALPLMTVSLD